MKFIEISDREYYIKTTFEELTAYEYYKLGNILRKPIKNEYSKEELEIKRTFSKDSDGFERLYGKIYTEEQKGMDIIKCVSNISKKYLKNYIELYEMVLDIILNNLDNLTNIIERERTYYDINNNRYYIDYEVIDWPFIKWCESENALQKQDVHTLLGFYATVLQKKNTKFDMYQSNFVEKFEYLKGLSAIEVVGSINKLLKEVGKIRESNYFVYNNPYPIDSSSNNKELNKVLNGIGWFDKIIQISQTPVFNGPQGTLEAVKQARTIEVLHYLNIKNARDMAESEDYRKQFNKK